VAAAVGAWGAARRWMAGGRSRRWGSRGFQRMKTTRRKASPLGADTAGAGGGGSGERASAARFCR
jgi:hypothetical protein